MKYEKIAMLIILLLGVTVSWAYPAYKIGQNFLGLDVSGQANITYVELDNADDSVFATKEHKSEEQIHTKLYRCKSPYYLRLEDEEGNTLWKTSDLVLEPHDLFYFTNPDSEDVYIYREGTCGGYEKRIAVDKNEQLLEKYEAGNCASAKLLYDAKDTRQLVVKKNNGSEVRLPLYLNDYSFWGNDDIPAWMFIRRNVYDEWEGPLIEEKPLGITIIDYNGNVRFHADTDTPTTYLSEIIMSPDFDFAIAQFIGDNDGRFIVIIGNNCTMLKKHNNLRCYKPEDTFFPKVNDYCVLYWGDSEFYIIDLRNGEVVSHIIGTSLDITQVGDALIGVVGYGPMASVIDITTGKLIQDLTDYYLSMDNHYTIPDVKISQSADEIWIYQRYSQGLGKTRHFRLGIK